MKTQHEDKMTTPHQHRLGGWCSECTQLSSNNRVDSDPAVRRAAEAVDRAATVEEAARRAWETAASKARVLRARANSGTTIINQSGMQVATAATRELRAEIADAEAVTAVAWEQFRTAAAQTAEARQEHRQATLAATARRG